MGSSTSIPQVQEDLIEGQVNNTCYKKTINSLPNEMLHAILDRLCPKTTDIKSLRFVSSRWNFFISSRYTYTPELGANSLESFKRFFESLNCRTVNGVVILPMQGTTLPQDFYFPLNIRVLEFNECFTREDQANMSLILKRTPNLEQLTLSDFHNLLENPTDMVEVLQGVGLTQLKRLTLERHESIRLADGIVDLTFTSSLTSLESLQLYQTYKTKIVNLQGLPLSIKIMELCIINLEEGVLLSILDHLPNLVKLNLMALGRGALNISLHILIRFLEHPNFYSFLCVPAQIIPNPEQLRQATRNLIHDGKIVRWWFRHKDFRLRIKKIAQKM